MAGGFPEYESKLAPSGGPTIFVQPTQALPMPATDTGGALVGEAIAGAGRALQKVGEQIHTAQDTTRANEGYTKFIQKAAELEQKYERDPDFQTARKRMSEELDAFRKESLSNIQDGDRRSAYEHRMASHQVSVTRRIGDIAWSKEADVNRAGSDIQEETALTDATRAGSDVEREAVKDRHLKSIHELQQAGWITNQEAVARGKRFMTKLEVGVRDQTRAGLIESVSGIDTTVKQTLSAFDPSDPAAEKVVAGGIKAKSQRYEDAIEAGAITREVGAKRIMQMRNEDWGELVVSRAQKLNSPAEIEAFDGRFVKDFAAGKYNGKLDADGFEKVRASLGRLHTGVANDADRRVKSLTSTIDKFVEREAAGLTPPKAEWDQIAAAARDLPGGDRLVLLGERKRNLVGSLRGMPVDAQDTLMKGLREEFRKTGGIDLEAAELIKLGDKFVEGERKGLNTDQLGTFANKVDGFTITPLDFDGFSRQPTADTAASLSNQVRERVAQAASVGNSLSRAPQYFRPEEKARLADIVREGGDKALVLASAIVSGAGEAAPAMLKQISDDAPLFAQAGVLLAKGGSLQAARDVVKFQELGKAGQQDVPKLPHATQTAGDREMVGGSYALMVGDRARVINAAEAIARVRMAREGVTGDATDATKAKRIYDRALQEASGAVFVDETQYGGTSKYSTGWAGVSGQVLVPPGVKADGFRKVIEAIADKDLTGLPNPPVRPDGKAYTAYDLHNALPIATENGYAFASTRYVAGGTMKYILGRDGKPWVMDWASMHGTLKQRVPDAFMGAR